MLQCAGSPTWSPGLQLEPNGFKRLCESQRKVLERPPLNQISKQKESRERLTDCLILIASGTREQSPKQGPKPTYRQGFFSKGWRPLELKDVVKNSMSALAPDGGGNCLNLDREPTRSPPHAYRPVVKAPDFLVGPWPKSISAWPKKLRVGCWAPSSVLGNHLYWRAALGGHDFVTLFTLMTEAQAWNHRPQTAWNRSQDLPKN